MCRERLENAQHLFCTCKVAQKVWDLCKRWIGRVTIRYESIAIHIQSFHLTDHRNSVNKAWKGVWVAVVTGIWNLRNKVAFRGGVVDEEEVFCLAQLKGWEWFNHRITRTTFSYSDWHFAPVKCLESL